MTPLEEVRVIRLQLGWSMQKLADAIGVQRVTLHKAIERGHANDVTTYRVEEALPKLRRRVARQRRAA